MNTTEANIKIHRDDSRVISVSVNIPVWNKESEQGNLLVQIPLLGIETIAKNEEDAETAIKELIASFCIASDRFGQGLEKELEALGWERVDGTTGEPVLGYNVADGPDQVIERLIRTGENYTNPHLEIANA